MPPLLLAATALAMGYLLLPFYGAIMWAIITAMLFVPVYRWLLPRVKGRRNAAAGLVILIVLLGCVLPFALVTAALAREASVIYQHIDSGEWKPALYLRGVFDALPPGAAALLERAGVADFDTLQAQVTSAMAQGSRFMAAQAFGIGPSTFAFVGSLGVTLYLAYSLVRDGDELAQQVHRALPVPSRYKRELADKFMAVVRATVRGSLVVAVIQGMLGGAALWFLDVQGALLWAVVMAFLSLLPVLGTSLVWLPVAVYFFITGAIWQGVVLVAYGTLVVGLADNLLRPMLVGKNAGLPDYVVMITTISGMAVFGINGFIIGPTLAAMFIAVWHLAMDPGPDPN